MSRQFNSAVAILLSVLTICTGCHPTQPFFFSQDHDLSHFLDKATTTEYADVDNATLADASETKEPLTISNPEFDKMWDLTLQECVSIALQNSKTIRSFGGLGPGGPGSPLGNPYTDAVLRNPESASTVYETARVESDPQRGVEAALADFDAHLRIQGTAPGASGAFLSSSNRPTNHVSSAFSIYPSVTKEQDSGLRTDLYKKTATGATFTLSNQTSSAQWNGGKPPTYFGDLTTYWTTTLEARWDQPLLQGRGTQVNRIPIILARINADKSLVDFETAIRNMVMDVEKTYWYLNLAYRNLETAKIGRDSAQVTWKIAYEKWNQGVEPVQAEAQAREQYFYFRSLVERSLKDLYHKENQMRLLLGLAATDGRLIRPIDEPTMARVNFDWRTISAEALVRSPELRKQKWTLKQREMELIYAKNQLLPRLDVGALYRFVGMGNELINATKNDIRFNNPGSTAAEELVRGDYQEFALMFNFEMPVGFRKALAGVRNSQLNLARDKAILQDQELVTTHLLTYAIRELDGAYVLSQTQFNRWSAAEKEVESVQALYKGGKTTLDLVLDAQKRRATAQGDFYAALADYMIDIADVHFRKGTLLAYNNIELTEGPWPQKAYWDALERARERDASYYLDYGFTRPNVVSRGELPQSAPAAAVADGFLSAASPVKAGPGPEPTPAEPLPDAPLSSKAALGEPGLPELESGPNDPVVPVLNAPMVRTARNGTAASAPPKNSAFDWSSLDQETKRDSATLPTGVQPAGFSAEISDSK